MYSWELEKFSIDRNYYIGGDDLAFLIDIRNHPQITGVTYNSSINCYMITTSDNYCLFFNAMPIKEAEEKGLVKKLVKK